MARLTHKALFEKFRDNTVITKCEKYARWTLPQLMADFTQSKLTSAARVERDYQEMGALLINHLASKLARLLFPDNTPFFGIELNPLTIRKALDSGVSPADLQSALAKAETEACKRVFLNASYAQLVTMVKHLLVTGNALVYRDSANAKTVTYGLQQFSIRRDGQGNMLDAILRECTYYDALPLDVQQQLNADNSGRFHDEQVVEVYTRIHRAYGKQGEAMYEVTQEVETTPVGTTSTYPLHLCPWQAPTLGLLPGEHYARGLVEDYAGGFATLSDLSEAAALYGVEIMRIVHLVSAGSGTDIDDLAAAETGEYIQGDPNSVAAHEAGDTQKMMAVEQRIATVFGRLAKAFMYEANTRDAERVTKYEKQLDAKEAENALGGVYSVLSEGIQNPLAHLLLLEVRADLLSGLIAEDIKLDIKAGIPALGRSTDIQNLLLAAQEAAAIIPPLQQLDPRISASKLIDAIFAGRSVDPSLVFKSDAEMQQEAQANQQLAQGQSQMAMAAAGADQLDAVNALQQVQGQR